MSPGCLFAAVAVALLWSASAAAQSTDSPSPPGVPRQDEASAWRTALARYRDEPPVARVVAAAMRFATDEPARLRAMADRARYAGLLPTLALQARRGQAVDLSAVTGNSDSLRTSTDDDLTLQATLSFDLPRLLFAPAEVAIDRERRAATAVRDALLREVVALYYERRRLQVQRDLARRVEAALNARILEIEALLNAFTNGAFQRMLEG